MSKVLILGAIGNLGRHVVQQAIAAGHSVSVLVRTPSKLPVDIQAKATVHEGDLAKIEIATLASILSAQDAVINSAGLVTEGQRFVNLVDRIVRSLESIAANRAPVCWFMAGAALLDIDDRGRRGVDLPMIKKTYWPHLANFDRIRQTQLDWRLLCPGPMVDEAPLGLARMRTSLDRLPASVPGVAKFLPKLFAVPLFASRIPQMIVSYADAAALILANLTSNGEMSRHRVGLALPIGMRGEKKQWTAKAKAAQRSRTE